jgi:hypothetical protein
MKHRDLSRKHFISLGVLGSLGLFIACSADDSSAPTNAGSGSGGRGGSGGKGGSGGSTGGSAGATSGSSGSAGAATTSAGGNGGRGGGGSAGSSGAAGSGGNGGAGGRGGAAGSAGSGGSTDGGGSAGSAGSKDAGSEAGKVDAGAFCTMNPVAAVSMNHMMMGNGPHYVSIPLADIAMGTAKTYQTVSAPGANGAGPVFPQGHMHEISLTAQDFAMLRAGMPVSKRSCDSAHMHQFVFRCGMMPQAGTPVCGADTCGAPGDPCP